MFNLDFNPYEAKAVEHCPLRLHGNSLIGGGEGINPFSVYFQLFIGHDFRFIAMILKKNSPTVINIMQMNGTLEKYLRDIDQNATEMFDKLMKAFAGLKMLPSNSKPIISLSGLDEEREL